MLHVVFVDRAGLGNDFSRLAIHVAEAEVAGDGLAKARRFKKIITFDVEA
jgi:hypothetical protein